MAYAAVLLFNVLLLLPNALLCLVSANDSIRSVHALQAILPGLLLQIIVCATFRRLRISTWLLWPALLLMPLEAHYILTYHSASSAHILATVLETDFQETRAYLGARLWLWSLLWLLHATLTLGLAIYIQRRNPSWSHKAQVLTLAICGSSLAALLAPQILNPPPVVAAVDRYFIAEAPWGLDQYQDGYPFGLVLRVRQYWLETAQLQQQRQQLAHFRFHARQSVTVPGKQVYVLVIGESSRADHWQLNGYARPTNPRLMPLPNLVNFPDMVGITSATRTAVPLLLTRKPAIRAHDFAFPERSLLSAFAEAGFHTYWLSTQMPIGPHDTMTSVYAREAEHLGFYNPASFQQRGVDDTALWQPLTTVLAKPETKQLLVLHTLGSHANYADRYPPAFDRFRPSLQTLGDALLDDSTHRAEVVNSYDNSILLTDTLLAGIIERLQASQSTSLLLYIADHGEALYDGRCLAHGHGLRNRSNFIIPALAWYSDAYARQFPAKILHMHNNRLRRLNPENVFPSLLDAAALTYDNARPDLSILSDQLQDHPRLIHQEEVVDYDNARLVGPCEEVRSQHDGNPK